MNITKEILRHNLLTKISLWRDDKQSSKVKMPDELWLEIIGLEKYYSIKEICRDFNLRPKNINQAKLRLKVLKKSDPKNRNNSFLNITKLLPTNNEKIEVEIKNNLKTLVFSFSNSSEVIPELLNWLSE
jgi:hypothetical protein